MSVPERRVMVERPGETLSVRGNVRCSICRVRASIVPGRSQAPTIWP
jgi:hypothetical protein